VGLIYSVGTCDPDEVDWISWISPMLTSIQSRAVEADQLLSVFCYSHQTLGRDIAQGRLPQILRRRHIDGLILSGRIEEELIAHISESRLPYVLMNVSDADSHADDAICFDEIFSGREATRHLIAEGHRRILYLGVDWTPDHYSIGMRRRGYDLAMEEAGLAARHVAIVEDEYSRFAVEFGEVMRGSDRPTAIVCYWETQLLYCLNLLEGLGLRRSDVAAVTVGWMGSRSLEALGVSYVGLPAWEMGKLAFDLLERKIASDQRVPTASLRGRIVANPSIVPEKSERPV